MSAANFSKFNILFGRKNMHKYFEKGTNTIPKPIRSTFGPFFHLIVCLHHGFAIIWTLKKTDMTNVTDQRVLDLELFAPIFFTSWNFVIQIVYFSAALSYDILHILSIRPDLQETILKLKGYIFVSSLFPFSVFVSSMFWSIYNIDRELVLPEVVDEFVPLWLNHCLHTNIVIFTGIEVLIANQLLPTFKSAFIGLNIIIVLYHTLFVAGYFMSGRWAYGIFRILTWPERIAFVFSYYLFTVWVMKIGMKIQSFKYSILNGKCVKRCQ